MSCTTKLVQNVFAITKAELSDHAPLQVRIATRRSLPPDARPIPRWLARHPVSKSVLGTLQKHANLSQYDPFERLKVHKQLFRDAPVIASKRVLSKKVVTPDEQLQVLMQTSRAVWFDQTRTIPKITTSMPALAEVVQVDSAGHVHLAQPERFQNLITDAMNGSLTKEQHEANSTGKKSPRTGRSKMLARWLRLWLPFNKKLVVQCVTKQMVP